MMIGWSDLDSTAHPPSYYFFTQLLSCLLCCVQNEQRRNNILFIFQTYNIFRLLGADLSHDSFTSLFMRLPTNTSSNPSPSSSASSLFCHHQVNEEHLHYATHIFTDIIIALVVIYPGNINPVMFS